MRQAGLGWARTSQRAICTKMPQFRNFGNYRRPIRILTRCLRIAPLDGLRSAKRFQRDYVSMPSRCAIRAVGIYGKRTRAVGDGNPEPGDWRRNDQSHHQIRQPVESRKARLVDASPRALTANSDRSNLPLAPRRLAERTGRKADQGCSTNRDSKTDRPTLR